MSFEMTDRRSRAFTLIELIVVVIIVALLIGILLPVLSEARHTGNRTKSTSHLAFILRGFATYAAEHGNRFPGFPESFEDGELSVEGRYRAALPYVDSSAVFISPGDGEEKVPWTEGTLRSSNYSFAMLEIAGAGRRNGWQFVPSGRNPVLADRNVAHDAEQPESIWEVRGAGKWSGDVAWGDGSVRPEPAPLLDEVSFDDKIVTRDDQIFLGESPHDARLIDEGTGE